MKKLVFVLLVLICTPAMAWEYKLGPYLPGEFYSVGQHIEGLGVPSGQYGGSHNVVLIQPDASWRHFGRIYSDTEIESISAFQVIDGGAGLNAWTENGNGAQCYTAWRDQGWKWRPTQTFRPPWALAGPSAAGLGLMALSEGRPRRNTPGYLAKWITKWEPITPEIPGMVIWDAIPWQNGYLLGCSLGEGQYSTEWAGRLVWADGVSWHPLEIPAMAGILRLYYFDTWPDFLWFTTVWGEVYRTRDLEAFERWHSGDYGHNSFLFEVGDTLVVASSGGKVWRCDPECLLIAEIPNTDFMSLSPTGDRLVGTHTYRGKSRPVVIYPKQEQE